MAGGSAVLALALSCAGKKVSGYFVGPGRCLAVEEGKAQILDGLSSIIDEYDVFIGSVGMHP